MFKTPKIEIDKIKAFVFQKVRNGCLLKYRKSKFPFVGKICIGVQKKKQYWIQVIKQCEISGNYHMQKRKIIRLADLQSLKAFYSLLIENENEVCRVLEKNNYQICRIIKKNNSKTVKAYFAYILSKIPENEKNG